MSRGCLRTMMLLFAMLGCAIDMGATEYDFMVLRERMVRDQIEARGIRDRRVMDTMRRVERHRFVPTALQYVAYEDTPLPIGEGQTISQPYIVALMMEAAQLKGNEKVLEIGTGSGYQAALAAELAREVYTIEIVPALAERAQRLLSTLGYRNIRAKCGDGYLGWPEFAPFDCIIVTAAPEKVPPFLVEQLAEGGRMVIPVGTIYQELRLVVKVAGKIEERVIIPVRFVPMVHKR